MHVLLFCVGLSIPNQTCTFVSALTLPDGPPVDVDAGATPRYTPKVFVRVQLLQITSFTQTNGLLSAKPSLLLALIGLATATRTPRYPSPHPLYGVLVKVPMSIALTTLIQHFGPGLIFPVSFVGMVIIRYNIGCGSVRFRLWLVVLCSIGPGAHWSLRPTFSASHLAMIGALWVGTRQFVHERSGLPPPSLASPSFTLDDPIRTTQHLLDRVYSLIPPAFRPSHIAPLAPPPIIQGCFRNHVNSTLLTIEREGFPIYYGHTPVTSHAVAAQSVIAIFPPNSPLPRTLHKFQSLVSRPPNCYIQFKLCACGSVHGYLQSLIEIDAGTPLYVGDPPVEHLDFVIHFDGEAFREHRVGGSGIVLWKHTTQGLTLLDTFAVPLFPCPDAAYAETVGAAHAVLMAARHFPHHRPSRILIERDNRPIIDFMNSVGKLRRTDLQQLLTDAQHALAFSLPPILWSYTPREFNKCADFLAGIARDYAKQPYSLSPFSFPLPPSLSSLYSPPVPLTLSPPSSAFTWVTGLRPRFLENLRIKKISFDIIMGPACPRLRWSKAILLGGSTWLSECVRALHFPLLGFETGLERENAWNYWDIFYKDLLQVTFDIRTGNTKDGWKKTINRQPFFWFGTSRNKIEM